MKLFNSSLLIAALLIVGVNNTQARELLGPKSNSGKHSVKAKAAGCSPAQSNNEFYINNVRTSAETGGNTWYDRGNGLPYYEVPAGEGNHAIFAGALWMGGKDPAGNLKLAAIRFRQMGNDYWPGPLSADGSATIEPATCTEWDRFWNISLQMVQTHRYYFTLLAQGLDPTLDPLFENGYAIPQVILDWPAHGDAILGQSNFLAPFADLRDPVTGDILTTPGVYEPEQGDYPLYDLDQEIDCRTRLVTDPVPLFGDYTMYWIFNDKGNVHTESQGEPIGMEIQAQMFGFTTNDEINNMTFCNYVLINRGSLTLQNTFFAQWVDTDLGNPLDDYIGCDVMRGLGYSYNGQNTDASSSSGPGYGEQPPAIGVDFFEGPYQDPDGINNLYGIDTLEALNGLGYLNPADSTTANGVDSIIDNERFGMRRFLFHNNSTSEPTGDPSIDIEYYNMMQGIWRNGVRMTYGGTGYDQDCQDCPSADFMFPGDSDPLNWGTHGLDPGYPFPGGWTEENEGNLFGDRRFVQSAGPFTLDPGEFNNITVGVVYARARTGGPFASVKQLLQADDKAQALFANCFRLLDGPDAPDLTAQELDKEIILYLRNTNALSNNIGESYKELDPTIPPTDTAGVPNDQFYRFQGYQVYQLKNSGVSVSDIENIDLARPVFQCDIKDFDEFGEPIGQIINYEFSEQMGLPVPVEKVDGANLGISHSIKITKDEFASGDTRLINFKKYYYIAIAYGYNNYQDYNPNPDQLTGQDSPYLRGRSSAAGDIKVITVIPHIPTPEKDGTVPVTEYGDGVPISRIEGQGNGGNNLELTQESIDDIMDAAPYKADKLTYLPGQGPINVKVVDPLNVKAADFILKFYNFKNPNGGYVGAFNDARWYLIDKANPTDTIFSENTIEIANEQILPEYGISVAIGQYYYDVVNRQARPASTIRYYPNITGSGISFTSGQGGWLEGLADKDGNNFLNWIRSGVIVQDKDDDSSPPCYVLPDGSIDPFVFNDYPGIDDNQNFEKVVSGTFAPARLVAGYDCGPTPLTNGAVGALTAESRDLSVLTSVDLYITSNKDKWSRSPVYEMQPDKEFSQLKRGKLDLRGALSVDKNGRNQLDPQANIDECTYNGQQVLTQADLDAMSQSQLDEFLTLVHNEYPSITTESQLVGKSFGMGWFPGYAISPETGERLNVAFSENSFFVGDNGRDMLWNPTSRVAAPGINQYVFGGQQYIFTYRDRLRENTASGKNTAEAVPMYDGGQTVYNTMKLNALPFVKQDSYKSFGWIYFPLLSSGYNYLTPEQGLVPGDVKITAHVAQPYSPYATTRDELGEASFPFTSPTTDYDLSENYWYPMYEFNTQGIQTETYVTSVGESALDLIDIVPNPYYAYSTYETSRIDNEVKFVNLPPEVKIQIFTINGTLIRVLEKDNPDTYLEWNLQNDKFVPIAGGIYLCHVSAPGLGERVVKFFCSTRPIDLRNF